uniref:Uncharacterized protein n=1 Tax=Otus sunia TaxID=257818 RepID=A0A8C8BCF8_9STRI
MNSRLRALGGRINNIRASELPKEKTRSEIICNVHFLDGSVQSFKVNVSLENHFFFKYIEIFYKYFGLYPSVLIKSISSFLNDNKGNNFTPQSIFSRII